MEISRKFDFYIQGALLPCHARFAYSLWDLYNHCYINEHSINFSCYNTESVNTTLVNDLRNRGLKEFLSSSNYLKNALAVIESASPNYYHFLMEIFPEIICGIDFAKSIDFNFNSIVLSTSFSFISEYISLLSEKKTIVDIWEKPVFINNCLIARRNHRLRKFREENLKSLDYIRNVASLIRNKINLDHILSQKYSPSLPRKFFVERRLSMSESFDRAIFPRELFHKDLKKNGYSIIYLEDLSVVEQIILFANAEIIASIHGAGLTNILFSHPDVKIIELGHSDGFSNCFALMADALDIDNYTQVAVSPLLSKDREDEIKSNLYDTTNILPLKYDQNVKNALF